MNPTSSARAAEAVRKHPASNKTNRFPAIAPPRPEARRAHYTVIEPRRGVRQMAQRTGFLYRYWTCGEFFVKGPKGQVFSPGTGRNAGYHKPPYARRYYWCARLKP